MNKQYKTDARRGIEWTDYTWNPVGGCRHMCAWKMPDGSVAECYAKTIAERVAQSAYPDGFTGHYWRPEVLHEPLKLKKPARIFMDSMSDLMGSWVPAEQVEQVLDICRRAPHHTFQLLTKHASRLLDFILPDNVWVGVSAPPSFMFGKPLSFTQQKKFVQHQLTVLEQVRVPVRWMSIEPLSFDIAPLLVNSPLEWAIIGAATNGRMTYQPQQTWVEHLLCVLDAQGTQVFFKGNLEWPVSEWREAFPHPHAKTAAVVHQEFS